MQLLTGLDVARRNALTLSDPTPSRDDSLCKESLYLNTCVRACIRTCRRTHTYSFIILLPRGKTQAVGGKGEPPPLHDHELADVGQLVFAPLVKPLADGGPRQSRAVFQLAAVGLGGDFSLPVLVADGAARHVDPLALCRHVVEAQPDLCLRADALAHVVIESVVLLPALRGAERAALRDAVFAGLVVRLGLRKCEKAF